MKGVNFDGDVSIGRNLALGGNVTTQGGAHIKGELKVEGWLDARNIKAANKGLFRSEEELKKEYPVPLAGWFAIVLDQENNENGFLYVAENGDWVKTEETSKPYEFIMDSVYVYATKTELDDYIQKTVYLTEEQYNDLVSKGEVQDDVEYNIYEDE